MAWLWSSGALPVTGQVHAPVFDRVRLCRGKLKRRGVNARRATVNPVVSRSHAVNYGQQPFYAGVGNKNVPNPIVKEGLRHISGAFADHRQHHNFALGRGACGS
jgi:hypothetical protein